MNEFLRVYLDRTLSSHRFVKHSLLSVFYALAMLILALFKGFLNEYLLMLIPTLIVNEIFIIYACSQKASGVCLSGVCLLNVCAAVARALFNPASVVGTSIFMFIGVLAAFLFGYVERSFAENHLPLRKFALCGMFLSLILCLFMPETRGAKAWFKIGDTALFQLTEIAKFFYVIYLGTLFAAKSEDNGKVGTSLIVTALASVLLLLANEFGTILVMCAAYFCLAMIKLKKFRSKLIVLGSYALVIGLAALILWSTSQRLDRWHCNVCDGTNPSDAVECTATRMCQAKVNTNLCNGKCTETNKCDSCKYGMPVGKSTYLCPTCRLISWNPAHSNDKENSTDDCVLCSKNNSLSLNILLKLKKVHDRFNVAFNYEAVQGSSSAFHMTQSTKAIKVGRLFGDKDLIVYIPSIDTDSIIAGLINRLGAVFALVVLLAFFLIFAGIYTANSPLRIAATFTFIFQALFTYLSTVNLMPLTGIGVPLISRGGSNLVVCYVMIYIMLTSMPNRNKEVKK
ncbi:MAG: FtsW/RodA/SpoVE family cell cycle protein [Clostridia bacterium]|nr:FtsW/RodA/SpoVE family cell cycle protein [Clostridia bacterium]